MHEIAAFARRTKPTTTILVDKLEALGYVARVPSETDARCTVVCLTPAVVNFFYHEEIKKSAKRAVKKSPDCMEIL